MFPPTDKVHDYEYIYPFIQTNLCHIETMSGVFRHSEKTACISSAVSLDLDSFFDASLKVHVYLSVSFLATESIPYMDTYFFQCYQLILSFEDFHEIYQHSCQII